MISKLYIVIFILLYSCYFTETTTESRQKGLPIGCKFIREIFKQNLTYVDKTSYAFKLFNYHSHLIMHRPRKFGKSLFLDTLKEIAEGNKDLFKNCDISKTNYAWPKYQVLLLDFSTLKHDKPGLLKEDLTDWLMSLARHHNISFVEGSTGGMASLLKDILSELSDRIKKKSPVVILIDEYDYPIVQHFKDKNRTVLENNAKVLIDFFTYLKASSEYIRHTFVTGVTKFALTNMFSGANHLTDISMNKNFDTMFGFTQEEIVDNFASYIRDVAQERTKPGEVQNDTAIIEEIRNWYDGYNFTTGSQSVYNPWSILNYFSSGKAESYWLRTGPSIANISAFGSEDELYECCFGRSIFRKQESDLTDSYDIRAIRFPDFLFQTGYLTISDYNKNDDRWMNRYVTLSVPNRDVEKGLLYKLAEERLNLKLKDPAIKEKFNTLKDYLEIDRLDLETFCTIVNETFFSLPHSLYVWGCTKKGFHIGLYVLLQTAGFESVSEYDGHSGSIDILVTKPKLFIIIELMELMEVNRSTNITMKQSLSEEYKTHFLNKGKFIAILKIHFNPRERGMRWECQYYTPEGVETDPSKIRKT